MKKLLSVIMAIIMLMSVMGVYAAPAETSAEAIPAEEESSINEVMRDIENFNEEDKGNISLFAANNTISGKINLPSGVTAKSGDVVRIYAYRASEFDGNVLLKEYDDYETAKNVAFTAGASGVDFSISVPDGSYNIAARIYNGNKNVSGQMIFYSSEGDTPASLLASKITVSGGSTKTGVNITLNAATSYISGTLDLSEVVPEEDTYINVSAQNESNTFYSYSYSYVFAPKGATEVDYELGLTGENVNVRISSDYFGARYYSDGTLADKYNDRITIDVKEPRENLDIKIPVDAKESGTKITINFPDVATEEERYIVQVISKPDQYGNMEAYADSWVYRESGSASLSCELSFAAEAPAYLAYRDITGSDNVRYSIDESTVFYSAELGAVGDVSLATDIRGLGEIVMEAPQCYTISGSIDTGDYVMPSCKYLYVGAEFEGGEVFCGRVQASLGTFKIYVPKRLEGEKFEVFVGQDSLATCDSETKIYSYEGTLTGNISGVEADAGEYREISGTVNIPAPAGEYGVEVNLGYVSDGNRFLLAKLIIKPGEQSAAFALPVARNIPEGAYLFAESTLYAKENVAEYVADTDFLTKDQFTISLGESVTYSGVIKTPDGNPVEESMTFQIGVQGENGLWVYSYASIEKGKSSTNYAVSIPKDTLINRFWIETQKHNDNFVKQIYYTAQGFKDSYAQANIVADKDVTLDIPLIAAQVFEGRVKAPENLVHTGGQITYYVYAQNVSTGASYQSEWTRVDAFTEEGVPFKVSVPSGDAKYRVYIRISSAGDSNVMPQADYFYVSEGNMTMASASAAMLSPQSGITLTLPLQKTISGSIKFADGTVIKGNSEKYISLFLKLISTSGSGDNTKLYEVRDTSEIPFVIPVDAQGSYNICVTLYNNDNVYTNAIIAKDLYLTATGFSENKSDAIAVQGDGGTLNLTVPKARTISGKINVGADYKCLKGPEKGTLSLTKSGESSSTGYTVYFDENLNYLAPLGSDVSGDYTATLSFGDMETNIIKKSYSFGEESFAVSGDVSGIDFTVETGYAVSGVVALPEDAVIENIEYGMYMYLQASGVSYSKNIRGINSENREIPFMFGVEKTGMSDAYLRSYINMTSGTGSSNLYKDDIYYVSNTQSTAKAENKATMNITGDVSGIRYNLLTGITYTFNLSRPEGNKNRMNGEIYLMNEDDSKLDSTYFNMYESTKDPLKVQFALSKEDAGKKFYMYYRLKPGTNSNVEGLYQGKVYIAPGGALSAFKKDIVCDTLSADKVFNIGLLKEEDVDFPDYVFASDHPYPAGTKSYTYTHPDASANSLSITFSEDTCLASGDKIKISGNSNYYYGSDLAGKTITVSGNSVTITIEATSYSQGEFGFGVTKIEGIKYIMTTAHPYICDYQEHIYEYTYPEEVESIDVTFADECEINSTDYLYVYGEQSSYAVQTFRGKFSGTVTIPGNYVKILHDINNSNENNKLFGFAVTEVKPTPTYTITYKDYDGTVLGEYTALRGKTNYNQPSTPETRYEDGWVYDFIGWDKDIPDAVYEDTVITAIYDKERYVEGLESAHPRPNSKTLTYEYEYEGDAENIFVTFSPKTALYGSRSNSSYSDNIAIYHYNNADGMQELLSYYYGDELSGTTVEIPGKKFKIIYTTKYVSSLRPFGFRVTNITPAIYHAVSFYDSDGTFLKTQQVPTQTKAVYDGKFPIRATGTTIREFSGWDKDVSCVTEDMEVKAVYTEREGYFESEHEYQNNIEVDYYYVHDNPNATELKITFSSDTRFDNYGDFLIFYNQYGNQIGSYTYKDLTSKTITVAGNAFSMKLSTNGSTTYYGFKITNIEAVIPQYYTVNYVDYLGNIIYSQTVLEGTSSWFEGAYPERPSENGVFYYFSQWDQDTSNVLRDMTVRPIYMEDRYTPIRTESDLRAMAYDPAGKYILMNDITLTQPWTPILNFTGQLRGEKHVIKNIKLASTVQNADGQICAGFFATMGDANAATAAAGMAMVRDTGFEIDYDIPAQNGTVYVGGIAAFANRGMFERCYVTGTIDVNCLANCVGGFMAEATEGMAMWCYSDVTINATGAVGGFAYKIYGGSINESYSNSTIQSSHAKGGFLYLATDYTDQFGNNMKPMIHGGVFNSERAGTTTTNAHENYCGEVLPMTSVQLKDKNSFYRWDDAVGANIEFWNMNEWNFDLEVNDGFPHLGFVVVRTKFEEATAQKRVDEDGEIITSVNFELTKEIEEEAEVLFGVFKDDRLIGIEKLPVSAGYQGGNMDLPYDADYVKILVWTEMTGLSPVTKMGTAEVQ